MGYGKVQYRQAPDTSLELSPDIWADAPLEEMRLGRLGFFDFDQFLAFPEVTAGAEGGTFGRYRTFADTGGTILSVGGTAGAIVDAGAIVLSSDGDNEGASLRWGSAPFELTSLAKKFWFEVRLKKSAITNSKNGVFVGLMEDATLSATVPIAAAGTIADQNLVGFHNLEADGDTFDTIYKADGVTAVTVKADAVTIVADTYVKLGMKFDPATGKLSFYKDGQALADTKTLPNATGTDFPSDVTLAPVMAILNATATTPGSLTADWWAAAQLFP